MTDSFLYKCLTIECPNLAKALTKLNFLPDFCRNEKKFGHSFGKKIFVVVVKPEKKIKIR